MEEKVSRQVRRAMERKVVKETLNKEARNEFSKMSSSDKKEVIRVILEKMNG